MSHAYRVKAGDTAPNIIAQVLNGTTPVNLSGATVRCRIRETATGKSVIDRAATITDATNGIVDGGDASTLAVGAYEIEFVVTYAGGEIQRFPQGSSLELLVLAATPVPA